ncbi:MAG: type II toxin-antitoxin system Phd/YefM family antitoxin [Nitrospirae bacterium]|nr:type II toxin-antitoxin system Phd/YefM family antitoxin [Nitrospirota bacterium]
MKVAGIREARQNITTLIREVAKGREVLLTDRGRPVARLVRPTDGSRRPFRSHRQFRKTVPLKGPPLSATVAKEREDRL